MDERSYGPGAEHVPPTGTREDVVSARYVQLLTTEHWGLLATRSMSWNESSTGWPG